MEAIRKNKGMSKVKIISPKDCFNEYTRKETYLKSKSKPKTKKTKKNLKSKGYEQTKSTELSTANYKSKGSLDEVPMEDETEDSSEEEVFNPQRASVAELLRKAKVSFANIFTVRTRSGKLQGRFQGYLKRAENDLSIIVHELGDRALRVVGGDIYLRTENKELRTKLKALEAENKQLKVDAIVRPSPVRKQRTINRSSPGMDPDGSLWSPDAPSSSGVGGNTIVTSRTDTSFVCEDKIHEELDPTAGQERMEPSKTKISGPPSFAQITAGGNRTGFTGDKTVQQQLNQKFVNMNNVLMETKLQFKRFIQDCATIMQVPTVENINNAISTEEDFIPAVSTEEQTI